MRTTHNDLAPLAVSALQQRNYLCMVMIERNAMSDHLQANPVPTKPALIQALGLAYFIPDSSKAATGPAAAIVRAESAALEQMYGYYAA